MKVSGFVHEPRCLAVKVSLGKKLNPNRLLWLLHPTLVCKWINADLCCKYEYGPFTKLLSLANTWYSINIHVKMVA